CLLPKAPSPATHNFILTSPSRFAIADSCRRQPLARARAGARRRRSAGERRGGGVDQVVDGGGTVAAVDAVVGQPVDPLSRDQRVVQRAEQELAAPGDVRLARLGQAVADGPDEGAGG